MVISEMGLNTAFLFSHKKFLKNPRFRESFFMAYLTSLFRCSPNPNIRKQSQATHVAYIRSGGHRMPPAPLLPAKQALGAIRVSTARLRGANRHQNCSGDVNNPVGII